MVVEINGFFIIKKNYGLIRLMEVYEMTRQKASNLPYTVFLCQHRAGHSLGKNNVAQNEKKNYMDFCIAKICQF